MKTIIIDACILIEAMQDRQFMEQMNNILGKGRHLATCAATYTEFINGLPRKEGIAKKMNERFLKGAAWLNNTVPIKVEINKKIIMTARQLATLNTIAISEARNNYKDLPQPSFSDYIIGALTFHPDVVMATMNHRDFPLYLFDRIKIINFQCANRLHTIAFYRANKEKFSRLATLGTKLVVGTVG